jgi:DNA-binding response OmpR family regulator
MTGEPNQTLADDLAKTEFITDLRRELEAPSRQMIDYIKSLQNQAEDLALVDLIPDLQRTEMAGQRLLESIADDQDFSIRANKVKIAHLRHELRTSLNALLGYSEILLEAAEDRKIPDFVSDLQKIHGSAIHLLDLVSDDIELSDGVWPSLEAEQTQPGSLLIVDDNDINRARLARRLRRYGYMVAEAGSGHQALEMAGAGDFDLILLDVVMAGMDGYEVLNRLNDDDVLRHVPVIMLSARDEIAGVVRGIEMGAEDYLTKPWNPVFLKARIDASLEKKRLRDQDVLHLQEIESGKKRVDDLLHVILPDPIIGELQGTGTVRPRRFEGVAVLFCDIVGFTSYCDSRDPGEVIPGLQRLVAAYEELTIEHNLEKIKTIGDSFMVAAGLLNRIEEPVLTSVKCGIDMISAASEMPEHWSVRVGIHWGPVMAGVIGNHQYQFDLWGDTVNTAARIEGNGQTNSVNLSETAWQQVSSRCIGKSSGMIYAKGKGEIKIFQFEEFKPN